MPEWWSYTLSDFLLFSPRTYYRMIERHNEMLWPTHLVMVGLGLTLMAMVKRPAPIRSRAISALLAMVWAWVGWSFVWQRYTTINWAAKYLVALFIVEVLLLVWLGVARGVLAFGWRSGAGSIIGAVLLLLSLLVYPLIALLLGRGWSQAEVFGVAPDPTAIGTVGVLLLAEGPFRWLLMIPPVLWCLVAGTTLYAMDSAEAWVPVAAAVLAVAGAKQSPTTVTNKVK
jgi:Family of unknown function (DUF6064)